jgi:tetratricopeptide (TPR) repeat protein
VKGWLSTICHMPLAIAYAICHLRLAIGYPGSGSAAPRRARPTLRRLLRVVALALLALLSPLLSQAEISATDFEAANKLYEEGKFSEAATAYAKLLQTGQTSAALYFNLGNAFFRSGQIGRAVAAYRLAGQITPRDPDVRANLQFARNQTQGPTLSPNRWQRWLGRLTLNEWTVLAACALWLWLVLLAVLQWRPGLRPALRGYAVALAIAALSLCALAGAAFYQARVSRVAIVIAKEADVRNGPLAESKTAFTAHDGAELRVLDQKDEWLEVSAGPREVGWLRRDQVLMPQ